MVVIPLIQGYFFLLSQSNAHGKYDHPVFPFLLVGGGWCREVGVSLKTILHISNISTVVYNVYYMHQCVNTVSRMKTGRNTLVYNNNNTVYNIIKHYSP